MAYICRLIEGTEPAIDLQYNPPAGWSLLNRGIQIADPRITELWGGQLEDQLVRRQEGKRVIPLRLVLQATDGIDLIDRVNALEERLRHAAQYRIDGWGDEVFLELQIDDSTDTVQFPVCSGEIDKNRLYEICGGEKVNMIKDVQITLNCEAYWEDDSTFTLENYVDNPGWWRWLAVPGDSWTEANAADVTSTQDPTIFEVMGYSLKMIIIPDAINNTGVFSDNIVVTAATNYYFECRCYHTAGADDLTARVYDVTNGAPIAASVLTFNNQDDTWEKLGVSFATPAGCVLVRIEIQRLGADSSAGNKTYYVDAVYLTLGTTAPTGWSSGRNLTNELDAADQINVLCVTEIPGEVGAETIIDVNNAASWRRSWVALKTHDSSHNFIWELLGANAVVTAGDATCIDSALVADGNAPGGQRVQVTFAGDQTMRLRTYWRIATNLASYVGKYQIVILCSKSANTDIVKMRVEAIAEFGYWQQGYDVIQTVPQASVAANWRTLSGWDIYSFPIGTHEGLNFGASNQWDIRLYASITGAAAWDNLWIAGAYLIPQDEAYAVGGFSDDSTLLGATTLCRWKDLDGERGLFGRHTAGAVYYSNIGYVGTIPKLKPKLENYLYFVNPSDLNTEVDITEACTVAVTYRPRGIFLRGTNP